MALKDLTMSKQGTTLKRKHVTLIIHQKLAVIRGLKNNES
jgi:hypothetical protein